MKNKSNLLSYIFFVVLTVTLNKYFVSGNKAAKSKLKSTLDQYDESSYSKEIKEFLNSEKLDTETNINYYNRLESDYAKTCYNMFEKLIKLLPNELKLIYINHIELYAKETSCGDATIFANQIKPYFTQNHNTLSDLLTKASKDTKKGLNCYNSANSTKEIMKKTYSNNSKNGLTINQQYNNMKNDIHELATSKYTKSLSAKSSVTNSFATSLIQKTSKVKKSENITNTISEDKSIQENTTPSVDNVLNQESMAIDINSKDFIKNLAQNTNKLNHSLSKCLLSLQDIAFSRLLNMVGTHSFINKVFEKDLELAKEAAASKDIVVSLNPSNRVNTINDEHYIENNNNIILNNNNNVDINDIPPSKSVYIGHKNDKKQTLKIAQDCNDYINNFDNIGDNLIDGFINQVNQIIGLEECNYYANFFNYNSNTDLIDQSYIDNLVSGYGLSKQKEQADTEYSKEKANYDLLNFLNNKLFNLQESEIIENWKTCNAKTNTISSEKVNYFLELSSKAKATNKNGLSTFIGRCDINYDTIKQSFSSYVADIYVECKNKKCASICEGCNKWNGDNIVLSEDTELYVSCCGNNCGVIVRQIQDGKQISGTEWYELISDEHTQPITSLLKMKLNTAFNNFNKQKDEVEKLAENVNLDDSEALKKFNIEKPYFIDDVLMDKLSNLLSKNDISLKRNKLNLLESLNLKNGDQSLEDFINENLIRSKNGGFLTCYKGECLSECASENCGKFNLGSIDIETSKIKIPEYKLDSFTDNIFYDFEEVFNKGSNKYNKYQKGNKLSDNNYQDKCIENKEKLGNWNSGYDLNLIKLTSNNIPEALKQENLKNFISEDEYMVNFIYGTNLVDGNIFIDTDALHLNKYNNKESFVSYKPFYFKDKNNSIIRNSLEIKENIHLEKMYDTFFKGKDSISKGEELIVQEFNANDWRPSYIKFYNTQKRVDYINSNINNYEIDIQCDEISCVLLIDDPLQGFHYIDFILKTIPLYNSKSLTDKQKKCFAEKIISFKELNPFYHNTDNNHSFKFKIDPINPYKNLDKYNSHSELTPTSISINAVDDLKFSTNFITKTSMLVNKSASTLRNKAKNFMNLNNLNSNTNKLTVNLSSIMNSYSFNLDNECHINSSPYSVFPVKPSCLKEFTYTCKAADFDNIIDRFSNKSNNCNATQACNKLKLSKNNSEQDLKACGQEILNLLLNNRLTLNYHNILSPCNNSNQKQDEIYKLQDSNNEIKTSELSNKEFSSYSNSLNLANSSLPQDMIIDGSNKDKASSDDKIPEIIKENNKVNNNDNTSNNKIDSFKTQEKTTMSTNYLKTLLSTIIVTSLLLLI